MRGIGSIGLSVWDALEAWRDAGFPAMLAPRRRRCDNSTSAALIKRLKSRARHGTTRRWMAVTADAADTADATDAADATSLLAGSQRPADDGDSCDDTRVRPEFKG